MNNGVCTRVSNFNFDDTVRKLKTLIEEKQIKLFCVIGHSDEAKTLGLMMPRTELLVFGNAKAGTPLMVEAPAVALDLPLKLLIAETAGGRVTVSWNDPAWLQKRHGFEKHFEADLGAAAALANAISM